MVNNKNNFVSMTFVATEPLVMILPIPVLATPTHNMLYKTSENTFAGFGDEYAASLLVVVAGEVSLLDVASFGGSLLVIVWK